MIYLFGSSGMLGNYVKIELLKKFKLKCIDRADFDILNDDWLKLTDTLSTIKSGDIIINCAGSIPQKYNMNDYKNFIRINSLFPHKLQNLCEKTNAILIHITTDCVFDGKKGTAYSENDKHTETNIYGSTKSLGEPENATIIRTSIIGEELNAKKSFLEWVKSNKNKTIPGYVNHLWNGVTCLQLAIIINNIIEEKIFWKGVRHIYSPDVVSKYELCCYISKKFNLNINVEKVFASENINKSLTTNYNCNNMFKIPPITIQIQNLSDI